MTNHILELKKETPVARGCMRLVYQHPHDPGLLVKVIRPEAVEERWGAGKPWYKSPRRYGRYVSYLREVQEFIAGWEAYGCCPHYIQRIAGFAETDLGLGLVVAAARDRHGRLARSLDELVKAGDFTREVADALDEVTTRLLDCEMVTSDPHAGNLVYAYSEQHGDHFVLIDGIGNSNILPFKFLSRRINRRSKERRFRRLHRYIAGIMPQNPQARP
jgi:hypothetical protein